MSELKSKTPLFFFLGLLLITAVYYGFIYMPMQKEINSIAGQRAATQTQLNLYNTYSTNIDTLKAEISKMQNEIDSALSEKSRVNSRNLPEDVQAAMQASGATLEGLQVSTPQIINSAGNFNIYQLPVSLRFQCSNLNQAFALLNYFEQSENSRYYVSKASTDDVMKSFSVQIDLLLYYPQAA